jgi:hypothetical protein
MTAPATGLRTAEPTMVSLTVENSLPTEITHVIVTSLMHDWLTPLSVSAPTNPANARIIDGGDDGQLVLVKLDRLASGGRATIDLMLAPKADLPCAATITQTATLFYRESVADQTGFDFVLNCNPSDSTQIKPTPAHIDLSIMAH